MGHNFKPAFVRAAAQPSTEISRVSIQAARLIETAMNRCGEGDLAALDCLMDARRALSPIVDAGKTEAAKPEELKAAE